MVSLILLLIIGVGALIGLILVLILVEEHSAPPGKIWVQNTVHLCDMPDELKNWWAMQYQMNETAAKSLSPIDYLKTKGVIVYDSKMEFKKELQQICEGCSCRTGQISSYLISQNDVPELAKLDYH